jgi:hypothetical protein
VKPSLVTWLDFPFIQADQILCITTVLQQTAVDIVTVSRMIVGLPVSENDAVSVLEVFSQIAGKMYSLDNVQVVIEKGDAL